MTVVRMMDSSDVPFAEFARLKELPKDDISVASAPRVGEKLLRNQIPSWYSSMNEYIENPDRVGLQTYRTMIDTDETTSVALEFMGMTAVGMLGPFQHPKKKIQKYVRKQIDALGRKWVQAIEDLCEAPAYGVAALEACFDIIDGELVLVGLPSIDQLTMSIKVDLEKSSKSYGDVKYIKQHVNSGNETDPIPADKIVLYSYRPRRQNPWGRSRLRQAWKNWIIKDAMLKAWGLTMERFATPLVWGKCSQPDMAVSDGSEMTRSDQMLVTLMNLQNSSAVVVGIDDEIGFQQTVRNIGTDFESIQNHMNRMIFRALLTPALIWESTDVGSFALGKKHFKVFLMAMGKIMAEIIPLLIRTAIAPVIFHKFGPQKNYGSFQVKDLQEEDQKILSDCIFAMTEVGYMSPEIKADLKLMRDKLGFEMPSEEDLQKLIDLAIQKRTPEPVVDSPSSPSGGQKSKKVKGSGRDGSSGPTAKQPQPKTTPKRPTKTDGRPAKNSAFKQILSQLLNALTEMENETDG